MPTLTLSTEQLALQYPTPQILAAIANGRLKMPEDPALRDVYQRLSERYKARIEAKAGKGDNPRVPTMANGQRRRIGAMTTEQRTEALKRIAPQQAVATELTEAKIYSAVLSNRQLSEVLADFWFNHFNVFLDKGADKWLTTSYDRDAIRSDVLGHFSDLVKATAQSPAMLFYLDNWTSIAPEASGRIRRVAPKARPEASMKITPAN